MEADFSVLKEVCAQLEAALAESRSAYSRRFQRFNKWWLQLCIVHAYSTSSEVIPNLWISIKCPDGEWMVLNSRTPGRLVFCDNWFK